MNGSVYLKQQNYKCIDNKSKNIIKIMSVSMVAIRIILLQEQNLNKANYKFRCDVIRNALLKDSQF